MNSEEEEEAVPVAPGGPTEGLNIPNAIEQLLADMADLKTRLATAEAEIATLKGA